MKREFSGITRNWITELPRRLLIFDLDETLVHATLTALPREADFTVEGYCVYQRPGLPACLAALAPLYDFAVWSSASRSYVDAVVEHLFPGPFALRFAWAVERCVQRVDMHANSYVYVKDLRKVQGQGYMVDDITMLDDSPEKLVRQPRNHVAIPPYLGAADDVGLMQATQVLIARAMHR